MLAGFSFEFSFEFAYKIEFLGIIIDTFGQLKNEFNCREKDEKNFCFICGIDREKLEKTSGNSGFLGHTKVFFNGFSIFFYWIF